LPERYSRFSHQVDHVVPPRHGGSNDLDNLAWSCFYCNNNKGTDLGTFDPQTKRRAWLFNPREMRWNDHFEIDTKGLFSGKTSEGRATIYLLDMNNAKRVEIRQLLIENTLW
jgi:HNH endonuclease